MLAVIRDWYRSLTDIRRGEWAPTALMFAYGFLALTSYYVLKPVRNSVFVDRVGADNLPYVYILTAVLITLMMVFYSRYVDRVKEKALLLGTFAFLGLNLVGFWWWLSVAGDSVWASGAFYIWGKLYPLLLVSQFYLVGNLLYTTSQARRLFGFIGVGLILGGIAGSSVSGWAAAAVGSERLLLVAAAILALCAGIVLVLAPRIGRGERASGRLMQEVSGDAFRLFRESSHLKAIACILGLTIVVGTLIDWQFNSAVERFIPGEDQKTAFFGKFFFGLNVGSVLIQLFFTGFVLRRFGVGIAMLALPAGLLVASVGIFALPLLVTAALAKGTEGGLRYSLDQSTRELLYLPVPTEVKYKVKPLIDLAVYRGGTGVGGLILIVAVNLLGLSWTATLRLVAVLAALSIALWILATLRMRGEFRASIRRLIGVRDVKLDELIVQRLNAETLEELREALRRRKEEEVLYALALLEHCTEGCLAPEVAGLLDHDSPEVRARAIAVLHEVGAGDFRDPVRRRLEDPALDVRVEAIRYLCTFEDREAAAVMREFLRHADSRVRVAATACMLRHGDEEQVGMAEGMLRELATADEAEVRAQAARLLSSLDRAPAWAEELLRRLFDDLRNEVRHEALRAAGASRSLGLVPELVARLASRRDRRAAGEALAGLGAEVHPTLLERLKDRGVPFQVRCEIPRLLVPAAVQETVTALLELLPGLGPSLRFETLKALNKLRRDREDLDFERYDLDQLLRREVREAYAWAAWRQAAADGDSPHGALLGRTLEQRSGEAAERASRLLGLRYSLEDLYVAFTALQSSDPLTRQRGHELLDNTLPLRYRELLDPLLDPDRSADEVAAAAAERYGLETGRRRGALRRLSEEDDFWVSTLARLELGTETAGAETRELPFWGARRSGEDGHGANGAHDTERRLTIMDIVERADLLRRTEIFRELRVEDLGGIAALLEERPYREGETIFDEGSAGTELFLVAEGRVAARRQGRTLFVAEAGETVGDLSLLDGKARNYTAVALTDARLLALAREDFYDLLEERFRIVRGVLSHLAHVIRTLNVRAGEARSDKAVAVPPGGATPGGETGMGAA